MFLTSVPLKDRISKLSAEIYRASNGVISFEEYIALPHYGRICLRYNLNLTDFSIEPLDQYEQMIYKIVKDEFIIDFMGEVYRKIGVDYERFDQTLEQVAQQYQDEVIQDRSYAREIREDAKQLLKLCGLDENSEVWEIQPEEEILLLILGREQRTLGSYKADGMVIHVIETSKQLCEGLTKAAEYAKRSGVSLARILLQNQSNQP